MNIYDIILLNKLEFVKGNNLSRGETMRESTDILNRATSFLGKYNIPLIHGITVYEQLGLIHCTVEDWRGPIEMDDFPVLSKKKAIELLIEHSLFMHFCMEEAKNRKDIAVAYPHNGGEYDCRKYIFEQIIKMFKIYDENIFKNKVNKYTHLINTRTLIS